MKTVFTTGQIAKMCKVAPRTVGKWFDSGRLRGYRIPGSQDRRIPREYLIRFLKEHGMPLGPFEDMAVGKVLVVSAADPIRTSLMGLLNTDPFRVECAASAFDAGMHAETFHPDCLVIDFTIGRQASVLLAQNLRKHPQLNDAIQIGLLSDEDTMSGFNRTVFNETFRKPFDPVLLGERIKTLVDAKKMKKVA